MLNFGIVGAGRLAGVHARHLRRIPNVKLFVFDRNEETLTAFASQYSATPIRTLDALIEAVDAVDVVVPNDVHHEVAVAAIEKKKATFVEKPLAHTVEHAQLIVDAAEKAQVPLMVGQVLRYFPEFEAAHRAVKAGQIGKPAMIRTRRGGAAPTGKGGWYLDHHHSGGVFIDLAIHDFDWLRWTFGEVESVFGKSVGAQTMQGHDYGLATLKFKSGAVAHVEATWMDPQGNRVTFEVAGSDGLLQYDSRNTATLRTANGPVGVLESNYAPDDDPFYRQLKAFVEAVDQGTPVPISGHEGLAALRIAYAALQSAQKGDVVTLG